MGFLDHSTNNIIIDAVLTDKGRELLARNNGTFRIVHYGFGDDEVDYTLIKKFGRTVGKEKIEKNTPVFEAQTIGSLGLKYPLISLSDPTLTVFPTLTLSSQSSTSLSNVAGSNTTTVVVNQAVPSTTSSSTQSLLRESQYRVELDSRFLALNSASTTPRSVPFSPNIIYDLPASSSGTGNALSSLNLNLRAVSNGSNLTQLQDSNKLVRTVIRVTGIGTGVGLTFEVDVQY
tara:strand:+ start:886 stop:1581 length:696 start_codon:yes stop_codon:yes gene_type:complete